MPEQLARDVFISHRGPDVKKELVSHIVDRLQRVGISVFVDYNLEKGCVSWPTILAHLRGAKCMLLLLTPRFEESPWCLEEVRVMAELREAVLPVYVDREPGSINEGCLRGAFDKFCKDVPDADAGIVKEWHAALENVSGISGWVHKHKDQCALPHLFSCACTRTLRLHRLQCFYFFLLPCRFEAQLVNELTAKLLRQFRPQARLPADYEVGLEKHLSCVEGLLKESKVMRRIRAAISQSS